MTGFEGLANGDLFESTISSSIKWIGSTETDEVRIVHHDDADGICSAVILSQTFKRKGYDTELICIEKVHPAIVKLIHDDKEGEVIIYTDLAGLTGDVISEINQDKNVVLILDHHPAKAVESDTVLVTGPELIGISGDVVISASTLSYLLAMVWDESNKDLSHLAVVGSVGDYHDRSGGLLGYDAIALDDALEEGVAKLKLEGAKEKYYIPFFDDYADAVAKYLSTLGAIGYYEGGFKRAIDICLHGLSTKHMREVVKLTEMMEESFGKMLERLLVDEELKKGEHTQWFHVHDSFKPMGVKTIGLFCSRIKDMSLVDEDKFIAGFQNIDPNLPDLGRIDWEGCKVSMRAPEPLERAILSKRHLSLAEILPAATNKVRGLADATHRIAAASLIDKGREEDLISEMEELIR